MSRNSRGFTLIELAIVLTAVALILTVIFVGTSLTRSAELQAVIGDITTFKSNAQTFQSKYLELPGDMANAQSFWGTDSSCPNSPYSAIPHLATCNGNGDGHITGYEILRVWQHLSNANMITGSYVGMSVSTASFIPQIGSNVPGSILPSGGYILYYQSPVDSVGSDMYPGTYGHVIMYGAVNSGTQNMGPLLTSSEVYLLDSKLDDGLPGSGNIMTSPAF